MNRWTLVAVLAKNLLRIVLSSVVALVAGIVSACAVTWSYNAAGWMPKGSGHPQSGLGEAIVASIIVLSTSLVGAVGGMIRRPLIGAFVGMVAAGLFSIWDTNGEWSLTHTILASYALVAWTAGGAAGGALGRVVYPSAAIEIQGKLIPRGRE